MRDLFETAEAPTRIVLAPGLIYAPAYVDETAQQALAADVAQVIAAAPWFQPRMPRTGHALSVKMTNCGALGWVSDCDGGYRYEATHPETRRPWPPIPERLLNIWCEMADDPHPPQACLVNFYDGKARMGLHQDRDEADLSAPVLSVSLGDSCLFRYGPRRSAAANRLELRSGDVLVLGGASRLYYHGVDKVFAGGSSLLPGGGRINLTLRRVMRP
ncbi:alpha-ketoglutarate-dependent dioxygenase AlkB family protein [Methylocapsa acidiphila]|uniref:alpha-ketoglutarate-dependent dioxygenase AlkB family protein n=1 Tax=Methylocapsa acidiphila TaxID=133552 RepID=UPI000414EC13|nr:alpha-ketoglutarate-dependent dioxygenase AlkB [Methylocapsa acidiphila]